ncbi:uncharacterized protein TRIADDRAFT_52351 [Trichoplax adhaerens]|uniref:Centrosomal protein of 78 kDa n=1 Tax=Trichoplax adhaerens TaxID=10228 RepID=B3RI20_TRIAD|nr:hypothetical protein TRIADDRAFT_52351 [Trichoplax adhaerens]EDV29690.1 hypothetical protein TRIADDRAFT_52351 [Trichoplax adhaerens]|eukprot:XP_002108892.1 hypothetical protein TRIADDRAFT_52351 [Trichoplax adhaerens]
MNMIETVQERHRGQYDFGAYYDNLCAIQNTCPVPAIKANLRKSILDCKADRIRLIDWPPLIEALRINKSLRAVIFKCCRTKHKTQETCATRAKILPIQSREIITKLCRALRDCILVTDCLNSLELHGIRLMFREIETLSKALPKNKTLQRISLENCQIKDQGLETLCTGLKNSVSITSLNVSGCHLTSKGAETLAKLILHQATARYAETWKESLRYRWPDLDRMPGLRRITACMNPLFGDEGASYLADALKDDLWLKALDLQQCGITNEGAKKFEPVLQINNSLVIVDLRANHLIDRSVFEAIMEQIATNTIRQDCSGFEWLRLVQAGDINDVSSASSALSKDRRTCNESEISTDAKRIHKSTSKFQKQFKITPNEAIIQNNSSSLKFLVKDTEVDDPQMTGLRKVEKKLNKCRKQLKKEIIAREKAESKLREIHFAQKPDLAFDNENLLSDIEDSLEKFHKFLDILRDNGYGNLWSDGMRKDQTVVADSIAIQM